jgi:hypothetical protein
MSKIKVNSIEAATGSTITIPSGQTLDISSTTLTLPSTVVTTTGTQTLTNKTIGVSQLSGTLPVANGGTGLTTLGSASQVLRVNSGATALEFGTVATGANAGEVIQVVNATYTSFEAITSSTLADTSLSASITPASDSNKVLVLSSFSVGAASDIYLKVGLKRGATEIVDGVRFCPKSGADLIQSGAITYLDTPNTTSSTTYHVAVKNAGSGTVHFNSRDNTGEPSISTITLMEIKG